MTPSDAASRPRGVFTELVDNEFDLVGIVAYAFYKRQKIDWVHSLQGMPDGASAADDPLRQHFSTFSTMPRQLEQYRIEAARRIESFLQTSLADQAQAIERTMRDDALIRATRKTFWQGVAESVVAGLFTLLLSVGLSGLAWVLATGPNQLRRRAIELLLGV